MPVPPGIRFATGAPKKKGGSWCCPDFVAFRWRDRVNEPGTVNDRNWTFRLPWPSNRLNDIAIARERQSALRGWSLKYGRL